MKPLSGRGNQSVTETGTFRPQLTSLIDVMTILLVFLVKSFSVEGNLVTPAPDLELPVSSANTPAQPRNTVEITRTAVLVDGNVVVQIADIHRDSMGIPELDPWLKLLRSNVTDSVRAAEVLIQCDREVEFQVVRKVMFTCTRAGFGEFSVLVLQDEPS